MPFTPSHALIALPFLRTPLVPAAIAIGAMTPDLPLFLRRVGVSYSFTHSNANIVWTGLLAFALFLVWRTLLRPAVAELSPDFVARRLPEDWSIGAWAAARRAVGAGERGRYPLMLAVSLLLGVVSHIVWDLFTHEGRTGVQLIPALDDLWGPLRGYKWLQHGSSVVGLLIIGIWMLVWLSRRTQSTVVERVLPAWVRIGWWISLPVILIAAWVIGWVVYGPFTVQFTLQHLAYRVLPSASALWGVLTVLLCVVVAARRARR